LEMEVGVVWVGGGGRGGIMFIALKCDFAG